MPSREAVSAVRAGATTLPDRPVLEFLGPGRFAAKTPIYGRWIPFDFLGFFRPNRDFSMGYTA
jgi:hypothetical protein